MTLRVGQRVVCVDASNCDCSAGEVVPVRGRVYTIRELCLGGKALRLVEIVNRPLRYRDGYGECNYFSWRFRPVVERKTDISIFTAMLNPSQVTVDAG